MSHIHRQLITNIIITIIIIDVKQRTFKVKADPSQLVRQDERLLAVDISFPVNWHRKG